MASPNAPMDISIMKLDAQKLSRVPRITTADTYDGTKTDYHPQGLFSTVLFGELGTDSRDYTFGHVKLNTTIMHSYVCHWIKKLKRMYEGIWMGHTYARWDSKAGEFIETDIEDGETGYAFFMSHFHELKFKRNTSSMRNQMIDNLEKYKDRLTLEYHLVLPPGLRDIMTDVTGKTTEDEINEHYRKLIRLSNSLEGNGKNQGPELNQIRAQMQITANTIYEQIKSLLEGKNGFLLKKFASRNLFLGTRNVVSSIDSSAPVLGAPRAPDLDTIMVGLFQTMKALSPIVINLLRNSRIYQLSFPMRDDSGFLVHPATLERTRVSLNDWELDEWNTAEGNERLIAKFEKASARDRVVRIRGHYLALVYRDDVKYQILSDISELPEGWDKKNVHPITYLELWYLLLKDKALDYFAEATRYPVTGDESCFVGKIYVKPTMKTHKLQTYENGQPVEGDVALEYPDMNELSYYETMSVPASIIKLQGGDFDGDKESLNFIITEEGIREGKRKINSREGLLSPGGKLAYMVANDVVIRVFGSMTKPSTGVRSKREVTK